MSAAIEASHSLGWRRFGPAAIILLSALLYWWSAWSATRRWPPVADEIAHVVGGLYDWRYGVSHLQPDNAYIVKHWATLPLLADFPALPTMPADLPYSPAMMVMGQRVFYESGNDPAAMLLKGRAMTALIGAMLVGLIGWWGLCLWGPAGAGAAVLAAFCPTLLAHGGLIMSDLTLSFFLLAAATGIWRLLEQPGPLTIFLGALGVTGALLTKMSGVLVAPLILGLLVLHLVRAPPGSRFLVSLGALLLAGALTVLLLWAAYRFSFSMFANPGSPTPLFITTWDTFAADGNAPVRLVCWLRDHRLLPETWLYGLAHTLHFLPNRPGFLNGEVSTSGWLGYFPYAWLVKTPLSLFLLGLLGLAAGLRRDRAAIAPWFWTAAPLGALFVLYWLFALSTRINIGHRHILPVYPPMLILAGGAALWWHQGRKIWRWLLGFLVGTFVLESVLTRPNYLSYFNILAGGPANGYRHLVDSNVDVGQDLVALGQWWREQRPVLRPGEKLFLSYFGPADPLSYGIEAVRFGDNGFDARKRVLPAPVGAGWYCLSVTLFQGLYTMTPGRWTMERERIYQQLLTVATTRTPTPTEALTLEHLQFGRLRHWLSHRPPDARIGHTMLLFQLNDQQVAEALYAPVNPSE